MQVNNINNYQSFGSLNIKPAAKIIIEDSIKTQKQAQQVAEILGKLEANNRLATRITQDNNGRLVTRIFTTDTNAIVPMREVRQGFFNRIFGNTVKYLTKVLENCDKMYNAISAKETNMAALNKIFDRTVK